MLNAFTLLYCEWTRWGPWQGRYGEVPEEGDLAAWKRKQILPERARSCSKTFLPVDEGQHRLLPSYSNRGELKALGVDENSLEFIRTAEELYLVTWLEDLGLPDCQAPEEEYKRLLAVCVGSQLVQLPGVRLWGSSPGDPGKACRKEKEEKRVHGMVLFWSISQKSRLVTLGVHSLLDSG